MRKKARKKAMERVRKISIGKARRKASEKENGKKI